ncbi:hypothetical protein OUZ56_004589 [Daphnia magna]|uniref:Uncharacterized protein n=1 Tax=Daphnia magna TaxID=35525 RepID=A0ABQ9YQB4_9CRUS|nr:hypothetical protein OUZ56_004589 [Daphnia magna]
MYTQVRNLGKRGNRTGVGPLEFPAGCGLAPCVLLLLGRSGMDAAWQRGQAKEKAKLHLFACATHICFPLTDVLLLADEPTDKSFIG